MPSANDERQRLRLWRRRVHDCLFQPRVHALNGGWRTKDQENFDVGLEIADRFHDAAGKFDLALSGQEMEIRLSRPPKDGADLAWEEGGQECAALKQEIAQPASALLV